MVDDYITSFPELVKERLLKIRQIILEIAPDIEERFSYGMPAYYTYNKPLVYYGAFEKHIGFYATPSGHESFKEKLIGYKQGKGSVQFPHNEPLPESLIAEMVFFRVEENKRKYALK